MSSAKLEIFHDDLVKILNECYPDYKIGEYFNNEDSTVQWLNVFDHDTNFKVAEAIAVEKFTSRYGTPGLLIIDYVNSDSRIYADIMDALHYMKSILKIASDRKKANAVVIRPYCDTSKENDKIAFLCDGKACAKMCANLPKEERDKIPCKHTLKEEHAKNKIRRKRKFKNVKGGLVEVE